MIPPRDGRRILYTPERVHAVFARMREELHELADRHAAQVAALRAELDEVRAQFDELRSISLVRQRVEAELASLYREREIARARTAERDPNAALN
jgi:hypothetical protein